MKNFVSLQIVKTQEEYIKLIKRNSKDIKNRFGVKSLCIFGSVARNQQNAGSDLDVCVEMPPKIFLTIELKEYLERMTNNSVDVVRVHKGMNPLLQKEIKRDGIYVI